MKQSPKVVNPSRFILSPKNHDYNKYKTKKSATDVKKMVDYFSKKQEVMTMTSYYNGELKGKDFHSFLMEDGHNATKEETEKRSREYVRAWEKGSNIYQTVLSFDNKFIDNNIKLEDLNKKLVTKILPEYFRQIGFQDMSKMMWNASLHLDSASGHYHYHIAFAEKAPNFKSPSAKKWQQSVYRRKGKISLEDFNFLKREVVLEVKNDGLLKEKRINLNKDIEDIKERFNINGENYVLNNIKDLNLQDKIDELSVLLEKEREGKKTKIKFNSLKNERIKKLTKDITKELFDGMLKSEKDSFERDLDEINKYYSSLNKMNNVKERVTESMEATEKRKYVDNYVYNALVNNLAFTKKKKITKEDIVKEVVRKNYTNKHYKPNKANNIIRNLVHQPSEGEIRKGIYALRKEMNEAEEEFSKSFQVQYSKYNNS